MRIVLNRSEIGYRSHIDLESMRVTGPQDDEDLTVGFDLVTRGSLNDILPIVGESPGRVISAEERAAMSTYLGHEEIDWVRALGAKEMAIRLREYSTQLKKKVEKVDVRGYLKHLTKGRRILERLQPFGTESSSEFSGDKFSSFATDDTGFTMQVRYSHDTSTGRLRVQEGPKVLTLAKEHRKIVRSRFSGGKIMSVDFVSLEPRLALHATGRKSGLDPYEDVAHSLGTSRASAKIATISFLYGAGGNEDVKSKVRSAFGADDLLRKIQEGGWFNAFGRPLPECEERLMIPHWVQSSAVDVALQGFSDITDDIAGGIVPLFMVHDELFLDVRQDRVPDVEKIASQGVSNELLGHFPLSTKVVS
jgi:hypothetical protein